MGCLECGRGFHEECKRCRKGKCHPETKESDTATKILTGKHSEGGHYTKQPENVKDNLSTGRKRAAWLYPIFNNLPCEWRLKRNCGGGKRPIVGCINGVQVDRHHGPVKNPLHNEIGNVHRICKLCHNRWHAANDPIYSEDEYRELLHNPEKANFSTQTIWLTK